MANDTKIVITAETSKAESAFRSLSSSVDGVSRKMFDLQSVAGTLGGALTVTAFAGMIKSAINLQDSLSKLSQKTGESVTTLAGLKFAADQNGASLESVAGSAKKLATNMAANPAIFAKFGIDAKSTTGALVQLADIFQEMPDGVEKTALAVKLMGKNGEEMIPFLNQGGDALQKMVEQGQKLYPVTKESAKAAEEFNDQLSLLQARSAAFGINISKDLLPRLSEMVSALDDLASSGNNFLPIGEIIAVIFETILVTGANIGFVFKNIGNEIGGIAAQLTALASGDFKAFSAIGEQMKKDSDEASKSLAAFEQRILNPPKRQAQISEDAPVKLASTKGKELLSALQPAAPKTPEEKKENTGIQVIIGLEKDYQNELAKRKDALNAPLLSASEKALADDMRNVTKRAQDSRIELEKLHISGTLSMENYQARLQDVTRDEEAQRKAISELAAEQDKLNASWEYGAKVSLRQYMDEAGNTAKQTQNLFTTAFKGMEDALVSFVKTGKLDFASLTQSIIDGLIRIQAQKVIAGIAGNIFGLTPNAAGGVYTSPSLSAYSGGIYNSPQTFAFANGAGIFAEAGPEAIMPLKRGADGKLGVSVTGGAGSGATVIVNVDASGQSQSGDNNSNLNELGQKIGTLVRGIMVDEMRPGGLLAGNS